MSRRQHIRSVSPLSNNFDSSDENCDAESTAMDSDKSETDQRRRPRQVAVQSNDCLEANLSDDYSNHATKNSVPQWKQKREPRMDLQIAYSDPSDIRPNDSILSNDSAMSSPEQILQHRLQRKPKLQQIKQGQFVRSVTAARNATVCDAPVGFPPFSDEDFENDNASTVASSNGSSNDLVDLRRRLKLHKDHLDDTQDSSPLASLPKRPICLFPDEADRKRIVGCLAVVLANSYAYETAPHLLVKEAADVAARVIGSDVKDSSERQLSDSGTTPPDNGHVHDFDTDSDIDGKVFEDDPRDTSKHRKSTHPHLQQHKMQQHLIELSRKQKQTSMSYRNRGYSSGNLSAKNPPPSANPISSFSFNTNAATRILDKVGAQNPPSTLSTELAEIRHRIRRHAILSEFLISSAEMLLLDPSHAKAFLPMLDGLLNKVELPEANTNTDKCSDENVNSDGSSRQSWKGRGFGGGGLAVENMEDENTTLPPSDQPSDMGTRKTSNDTIPQETSTKTTQDEGGALESINTHKLFPPSSRVNSTATLGEYSDPRSSTYYAPLETAIIEGDLVAPFLQTLTPGAGFRCIALLLLNHLLCDGRGYDARIRHALKRLAVIVISHELKVGGILRVDLDDEEELDTLLWGNQTQRSGENENLNDANELALLATRKFEALEHAIAEKLILLSADHDSDIRTAKDRSNDHKHLPRVRKVASSVSSLSSSTHGRIALAQKDPPTSSQYGVSREQLLRGIKVGTAGAVGATLFALTGGLAAPGIAAGLAAVGASLL